MGVEFKNKPTISNPFPNSRDVRLNIPILDTLNLNARGLYIAGRTPFLPNALRNASKKDYFPAYFVGDLALWYRRDQIGLGLQVYNLPNTN